MWTKARITIYLTSLFMGIATLLAVFGLATFDRAEGMLTIHPIYIGTLVGFIAPMLATGIAAVAAWLGWGGKS
jgi:hypothetical protein